MAPPPRARAACFVLPCLGGLFLIPLDGGYLAGKTGDASSCSCHLIHSVAIVRAYPVCALVSSWVHIGTTVPLETLCQRIVRMKRNNLWLWS